MIAGVLLSKTGEAKSILIGRDPVMVRIWENPLSRMEGMKVKKKKEENRKCVQKDDAATEFYSFSLAFHRSGS